MIAFQSSFETVSGRTYHTKAAGGVLAPESRDEGCLCCNLRLNLRLDERLAHSLCLGLLVSPLCCCIDGCRVEAVKRSVWCFVYLTVKRVFDCGWGSAFATGARPTKVRPQRRPQALKSVLGAYFPRSARFSFNSQRKRAQSVPDRRKYAPRGAPRR